MREQPLALRDSSASRRVSARNGIAADFVGRASRYRRDLLDSALPRQ